MGNGKKKEGIDIAAQTSLFDVLSLPAAPGPGSFHIQNQLKEEISKGLRLCRLSRYEVAAKMSEMLGYEITKTMLDAYTAESKENHRFPAEWLAPFCIVTGYYEPIKAINRLARLPLPDTGKLLDMEIIRIKKEMAGMGEELRKYEGLKQLIEKGGGR